MARSMVRMTRENEFIYASTNEIIFFEMRTIRLTPSFSLSPRTLHIENEIPPFSHSTDYHLVEFPLDRQKKISFNRMSESSLTENVTDVIVFNILW